MTEEAKTAEIIQPSDREIARLNLTQEHASRSKRMDMGLLGRIFGSTAHAPGNVAGVVVLASFALFAVVLFWVQDTPSLSKKDALLIVASFISLGLGFLFGRNTGAPP
jgi:hypothetical protein